MNIKFATSPKLSALRRVRRKFVLTLRSYLRRWPECQIYLRLHVTYVKLKLRCRPAYGPWSDSQIDRQQVCIILASNVKKTVFPLLSCMINLFMGSSNVKVYHWLDAPRLVNDQLSSLDSPMNIHIFTSEAAMQNDFRSSGSAETDLFLHFKILTRGQWILHLRPWSEICFFTRQF